jgi:hypothetical protein
MLLARVQLHLVILVVAVGLAILRHLQEAVVVSVVLPRLRHLVDLEDSVHLLKIPTKVHLVEMASLDFDSVQCKRHNSAHFRLNFLTLK